MEFPDPTDRRPTGVEPFDHSDFAHVLEYQAVAASMDALVRSLRSVDVMRGQADWLRSLAQIGAAVPFADMCSKCRATVYPCAGRITPGTSDDAMTGDALKALHRCGCGETWTCGWATTAPDLIGD